MSTPTRPPRGPVSKPIRSFSGVYEWSPRILDQITDLHTDDAADVAENIAAGLCPRCERPFAPEPEMPAGSRVTSCRSVPVCGRCGSDEAENLTHPSEWPMDRSEIDARHDALMALAERATFDVAGGQVHALTDDGVTELRLRPHPGGWAEHGYVDGTFDGGDE